MSEDVEPVSPPTSAAPPSSPGFGLRLTFVVLVGLAGRVAVTLVTKGSDADLTDEGDALYYGLASAGLVEGRWFENIFTGAPMAEHGPLTVLVLYPAAALFGSTLSLRLTMTLIGAAGVGLIGLAGREMAGRRVGLVAAVLAAAHPALWVNDSLVMSESVVTLLLGSILLVVHRRHRRRTIRSDIALGILMGLMVLTRSEYLLLVPLLVLPTVLRSSTPLSQRLVSLGLVASMMALLVLPWTAYLNTQLDRPVLISTNDGTTIRGANCDETYSGPIIGFWSIRCATDGVDERLDASVTSARQRRAGIDHALGHLGDLPTVVVAREGRTFGFWGPSTMVDLSRGEGRPATVSWAGYATFWAFVVPSVFGLRWLRRRQVTIAPLVAVGSLPFIVSAAFNGIPRHRLPLDVVTCILLAAAVVGAWDRHRAGASRQSPGQRDAARC